MGAPTKGEQTWARAVITEGRGGAGRAASKTPIGADGCALVPQSPTVWTAPQGWLLKCPPEPVTQDSRARDRHIPAKHIWHVLRDTLYLGHKMTAHTFKWFKVIQSMLSGHSGRKLETSNGKKFGKLTNT